MGLRAPVKSIRLRKRPATDTLIDDSIPFDPRLPYATSFPNHNANTPNSPPIIAFRSCF